MNKFVKVLSLFLMFVFVFGFCFCSNVKLDKPITLCYSLNNAREVCLPNIESYDSDISFYFVKLDPVISIGDKGILKFYVKDSIDVSRPPKDIFALTVKGTGEYGQFNVRSEYLGNGNEMIVSKDFKFGINFQFNGNVSGSSIKITSIGIKVPKLSYYAFGYDSYFKNCVSQNILGPTYFFNSKTNTVEESLKSIKGLKKVNCSGLVTSKTSPCNLISEADFFKKKYANSKDYMWPQNNAQISSVICYAYDKADDSKKQAKYLPDLKDKLAYQSVILGTDLLTNNDKNGEQFIITPLQEYANSNPLFKSYYFTLPNTTQLAINKMVTQNNKSYLANILNNWNKELASEQTSLPA